MGILLGGDKKVLSVADLYPKELVSTRAMCESFSRTEAFLESIIKTYCTLVGLGARFVYDFQRL
jgi:hypothetical protein